MELNRDQLLQALGELDAELAGMGVNAVLHVIGGAAIALKYNGNRSTADIDSLFDQYEVVRRAIDVVADRRGLPRSWVNSQIHDLGLPLERDTRAERMVIGPNLTLTIPSAEFLLFTKLIATRQADQDFEDAVILARYLGLSTPADIEQAVRQFGWIDGPVELLIEEVADEL